MITLKCKCIECDAEYELAYDDDVFIEPKHCAFCGNLNTHFNNTLCKLHIPNDSERT